MSDSKPPALEMDESRSGLLVAVQTQPKLGQLAENLAEMERVITNLPRAGDKLLVFPEMGISGYFFSDRQALWNLSEAVPEGPITRKLIKLAAENDAYIVAGLPERDGESLYNCAVLVGPEGYVTKYRKMHLWDREKLLYEPGNSGMVVVETAVGKIGLMICYDLWFPEQARILGLLGADVIAMPAALVWNDTPGHVKRGYYLADYVAMVTAHLNQVHLAMASQAGHYADKWLFGSSILAGPYGWPLAGPADDSNPAVLQAEVDFLLGRRLRGWSSLDDFDQDRRTDVYDPLLGYSGNK
ncbi:MAG TPA: nitrilase-related carbon-nitrogen hydrolase [Anaerolineales bacterium]